MSDKILIAELKNKIADKLRECDLTVSQLAQLSHTPIPEMREIINGKALPSLNALRRLCKALNIPLSYFID